VDIKNITASEPVIEEESIILTLSAASYEIYDINNEYQLIDMEGFSSAKSPGDPILPHKIFNVLVHPDINLSTLQLKIISSQSITLSGTYNIKPAGPICTWDEGEQLLIWGDDKEIIDDKNMNVYSLDENYPRQYVYQNMDSQMRKWMFIKIDFIPFQYNPVSQQLSLVEAVTIE
jgi:hypothetical protein